MNSFDNNPQYNRSKFQLARDIFYQGGLRVVVFRDPNGPDGTVRLIRTHDPKEYSHCIVKIPNTELWRIVRNILEQFELIRSSQNPPAYFTHTCADRTKIKIGSFPLLKQKGFITTISICRYSNKTTPPFLNLPVFNPVEQQQQQHSILPPALQRDRFERPSIALQERQRELQQPTDDAESQPGNLPYGTNNSYNACDNNNNGYIPPTPPSDDRRYNNNYNRNSLTINNPNHIDYSNNKSGKKFWYHDIQTIALEDDH